MSKDELKTSGSMEELAAAIDAVLRDALDRVEVHPCDEHNDAVRANGLPDAIQRLYRARAALDMTPAVGKVIMGDELVPAGYLLQWPSMRGGRQVIYSTDRVSADAIGCPVEQVFKKADGPNAIHADLPAKAQS